MVWFAKKNNYQSEKLLGTLLALALGYYSKNENIKFSDFYINLQEFTFESLKKYNIQIIKVDFDSSVNVLPPDQIGRGEALLERLKDVDWDGIITLEDLESLYNTKSKEEQTLLSYYLSVQIVYDLKDIKKNIFDDLLEYAELYVGGKLINMSENVTLYKKEKEFLLYNLHKGFEEYGYNLWLDKYLLEMSLSSPFDEDNRLFIHHVLGLLLENYISEMQIVDIERYDHFKFFVLLNAEKLNNIYKRSDGSKSLDRINFPNNNKPSSIIIRWLNGNDVEISIKGKDFKKKYDYKELGFYNEKSNIPNMNWKIFSSLALNDGKMLYGNLDKAMKENIQQRKSQLSKKLRKLFNLVEDPFYTDIKNKEYVLKLNLIPEGTQTIKEETSWKDILSEREVLEYEEKSKNNFINDLDS